MDLKQIANHLLTQDVSNDTKDGLVQMLRNGTLRIVELVKELDPVLTNGGHEVRFRGVNALVSIITSLPNTYLSEKEIEVLSEFLGLRLIDHKSMEMPTLTCLSHFINCANKPAGYNMQLLDFLKTKTSVQKMEPKIRHKVYSIVRTIIYERKQKSLNMDSDLVYSIVHIIEGENNPENLILCFGFVSFILKNFSNLEPYIDDLFEWLSSYYPIDYTPHESNENGDGKGIQRSDLIDALYDCFYASPLTSENLQTLLLEKLDSNLTSTKLESLNCLIKCYDRFPISSIKDYSSTLWTSIRMSCLKKADLIEPDLLDTSLKALSALATRLSEDGDLYFTFISDMYDELAIAFRKPEMELFEPAAKLLTHAVLPQIVGFNYILSKLLPVSINSIREGELRPLAGLAYIFEKLQQMHGQSKLKADISEQISKLLSCINDHIANNKDSLRLLNAVICQQTIIDKDIISAAIDNLLTNFSNSSLDLEESLALLCINYKRFDIIFDEINHVGGTELESMLKLISHFTTESSFPKLSIYLRLLILQLDSSGRDEIDRIDQNNLQKFLQMLRTIAAGDEYRLQAQLVGKTAQIHAIILNKLKAEYVNPILIEFFGSSYCQDLKGQTEENRLLCKNVYLPVIGWIFKSLVVRNHPLSVPLINLILNFITSDGVSSESALAGCQLLGFILADEVGNLFQSDRHYQRFILYKQKFYFQTSKEIRIRYEKQQEKEKRDPNKEQMLLCSIALQVPHLPSSVHKKDNAWLIRQLLMMLSTFGESDAVEHGCQEQLLYIIYGCIEDLIQKDLSSELAGFLTTLVNLNLKHAQTARTLRVRQRALVCLANTAISFKSSDLLPMRADVVDRLRPCLEDKKRLVRQAAAEARLKWILIGQPIG